MTEIPDGPSGNSDLRIGVFVCYCGSNIGGYVDVPAVAQFAKGLKDVVHVEDRLYTCSQDSLTAIQDAIREHRLNRVIVASCTPRTHAPLFQSTCEAAGLNKYLFTFVNIREQCSWVHMEEKERGTQKAKDLVQMGVARARLLEAQDEARTEVKPVSMVVGGGISGMTSALNLAKQGFDVNLVEKESELGGYIKDMDTLWEGGSPRSHIDPLIQEIIEHPRIKVHLGTVVESVDGHIGDFKVSVLSGEGVKVLEAGTIILAIGAEEFNPQGLYGYGEIPHVVTLADFERSPMDPGIKEVAFIQCAGARGQVVDYCSRICCNVAIKSAIHIADMVAGSGSQTPIISKEGAEGQGEGGAMGDAQPRRRRTRRRRDGSVATSGKVGPGAGGERANITIFNRTVNAYGVHHEILYNEAREKRVKFIKYDLEHIPKVTKVGEKVGIEYYAEALGGWRSLTVDLLVLSTPLVAHSDSELLGQALKVARGPNGFFLEAHMKLRPVEFATDGVYLAGTCRAPADITESILQANAAASRAAIPLVKGYVTSEALTAIVDPEPCVGCGNCITVCPFNALEMVEGKARTIVAACKGCGACASICPQLAITMTHYKNEQILQEALSVLEEVRP